MTAVPKKSPVERDLLASVVKPVVEAAGGRQRVVQLTGAANSTVGRWLEGDIGFDGLIRLASATRTNITLTFPAHGKPTGDAKESPPAWAEGLEERVVAGVVSALATPELLEAAQRAAGRLATLPPQSDALHGADAGSRDPGAAAQ